MSADQQFTIALAAQGAAMLASVLAFLTGLLAFLAARRAVAKAVIVEEKVEAVAGKIAAVHNEMNGMKTALVKATGEAEHAAGVVEGTRAERANPMGPVVP